MKFSPLPYGQRWFKIASEWVVLLDIGCPDFAFARYCRAHQHDTDRWWERMEWARNQAQNKESMPDTVPEGGEWLPKAGKKGQRYAYDESEFDSGGSLVV